MISVIAQIAEMKHGGLILAGTFVAALTAVFVIAFLSQPDWDAYRERNLERNIAQAKCQSLGGAGFTHDNAVRCFVNGQEVHLD